MAAVGVCKRRVASLGRTNAAVASCPEVQRLRWSDTPQFVVDFVGQRIVERRSKKHALPPVANPDTPRHRRSWLPPVRFRTKAFIKFCISFDRALANLEARYPTRAPLLTIEGRAKKLKRRPK